LDQYVILEGRSQLYEELITEPSNEENMSLIQWKFWIEGVLIPAVGMPGVCGRICIGYRYIQLS
jgi:hypothetical protein